jgi:hypothetical protein
MGHLDREAREKVPSGALVATDPASVDANYDNGAAVQDLPRRGRRDGDEVPALACVSFTE